MAGIGILKTLAAFEFPEKDDSFTEEMIEILKIHADELEQESE